jgi:hypothetical protein
LDVQQKLYFELDTNLRLSDISWNHSKISIETVKKRQVTCNIENGYIENGYIENGYIENGTPKMITSNYTSIIGRVVDEKHIILAF